MRKVVNILTGIITCFFIVLISCDKNDDLSPLPEKLIFSLSEKFHPDSSQIILKVQSEEEYPCSNFEIIYSLRMSGSTKIVEFEGITNHGFCLTAIGPAKASVTIANGENHGVHLFEFQLNDNNDSFDFEIKEPEVVLEPKGSLSGHMVYDHSTLKRLEEFTHWA